MEDKDYIALGKAFELFLSSKRFRILGCAELGKKGYQHIGMEIWTQHGYKSFTEDENEENKKFIYNYIMGMNGVGFEYKGRSSKENNTLPTLEELISVFKEEYQAKENPVKEILNYLNDAKRKLTGNDSLRGFRETPAAKALINARLKETFTVEDFKMVIDYKCHCWKDDKKMQEYIRPSTLFKASHFSEYLCESEGNKNNPTETNIPETPQTAEEIYNRMAKEAGK